MKKYIFSAIFILLLLLSVSLASSAGIVFDGVVMDGVTVNKETSLLMPLGDSITVGSGPQTVPGYRALLYDSLSPVFPYRSVGPINNGTGIGSFGEHAGVNGETTAQIESRTAATLDDRMLYPFPLSSIVLLHAGTNDVTTGVDSAVAVQNVMDIIDLIKAHGSNIAIYVALIIPRTDSEDSDTTIYNGLLNTALLSKQTELAGLYGSSELYIVDMNTAVGGGFKSNPDWATVYFNVTDQVHPNTTGYGVMAQIWKTAILANEN